MARIVIAGAGAVGASIAYHLALLGARDVVLAERDRIASGATGKAMGGFRQQFSSEAEVRLAQESAKLFRELGPPLFEAVGYMFLATSADGWSRLRDRAAMPFILLLLCSSLIFSEPPTVVLQTLAAQLLGFALLGQLCSPLLSCCVDFFASVL